MLNKKLFNRNNLPEISLMILLDLCFVLAFVSAFYFIAQKIIEILIYVAQISAGDALALTRTATDPYIVIPLYTYLSLLVFSLSAIWIIFQGINWWIALDIIDKFNKNKNQNEHQNEHHSHNSAHVNHVNNNKHTANHDNYHQNNTHSSVHHKSSHHENSLLKFMLKFAGISIVWLFFISLVVAAAISLLVANFASQIVSVNEILVLALIAILFFSYFYVSTLREIRSSFIQSITQGFVKSFAWKYFLKFIIMVLIIGWLSYLAYFFMYKVLAVSIIIAAIIIVSLSYFRIVMNLEV